MRGHDDGRAEGPEFKSQIKARRSAEDEKIVALILWTGRHTFTMQQEARVDI